MDPYIVITDYKLIRQALVKQGDTFAGRPSVYFFEVLQAPPGYKPFMYGIIFAAGNLNKLQLHYRRIW